jgi:hypothetical protein
MEEAMTTQLDPATALRMLEEALEATVSVGCGCDLSNGWVCSIHEAVREVRRVALTLARAVWADGTRAEHGKHDPTSSAPYCSVPPDYLKEPR